MTRWLFYPYLDQQHAFDNPQDGTCPAFTPCHALAVEETLKLACGLACCLDTPTGCAAADLLWQHVVPPGALPAVLNVQASAVFCSYWCCLLTRLLVQATGRHSPQCVMSELPYLQLLD